MTGAYNQNFGGGIQDGFILKFNSDGARLWATYYGGSGREESYSLCTDDSDNLYITGWTRSPNFPTQTFPGSYNQTTIGSDYDDAFILKFSPTPVGVNTSNEEPPIFSLHQNYPNPFNQNTTIEYSLSKDSDVKLVIFNLFGQKIHTLVNTRVKAGNHRVVWNGRDIMDSKVTPGVYIYKIEVDDYQSIRKMQIK